MNKGKTNGPASEYAKPHTMTGKPVHGDAGVEYMTDPNSMLLSQLQAVCLRVV